MCVAVESVSSSLLLRGGTRAESGLVVERMDVGSPHEARLRPTASEKQVKHGGGGRKLLQAGRRPRETAIVRRISGGGVEEGDPDDIEGWGSGAEPLMWETTPPGGTATGRLTSPGGVSSRDGVGRLSSTGAWEGVMVPSRVMEELPLSSRASPTLSRGSGHLSDDIEGDSDGLSDDSDSSGGTVVSLSTSLPIKFSGLQQQQRPSPLTTAASVTAPASAAAGEGRAGERVDVVGVSQTSGVLVDSESSPTVAAGVVSAGIARGERMGGGGGAKRVAAVSTSVKGLPVAFICSAYVAVHCQFTLCVCARVCITLSAYLSFQSVDKKWTNLCLL